MFQFATSRSRRRWMVGLTFLASALLPAAGLAACDSGSSSTPNHVSGGTPIPRSGETIFARYCNTCHPGGGRGVGPSLVTMNYSVEKMKATVRHGKAQMPGFGVNTISDNDLDALAAYIQGLRH